MSRRLDYFADIGGHATEIASLGGRIDVDDRANVIV